LDFLYKQIEKWVVENNFHILAIKVLPNHIVNTVFLTPIRSERCLP